MELDGIVQILGILSNPAFRLPGQDREVHAILTREDDGLAGHVRLV